MPLLLVDNLVVLDRYDPPASSVYVAGLDELEPSA
jgi:hypothetical protein